MHEWPLFGSWANWAVFRILKKRSSKHLILLQPQSHQLGDPTPDDLKMLFSHPDARNRSIATAVTVSWNDRLNAVEIRKFWGSRGVSFPSPTDWAQKNGSSEPNALKAQIEELEVEIDLSPKFPPALRGVLGVKSLALGRHLVHRLSLQKFHRCQVGQC